MKVVVTTAAVRRAKLQSNHHHQQTNTQFFTDWIPFLSCDQQCQSTEGKLKGISNGTVRCPTYNFLITVLHHSSCHPEADGEVVSQPCAFDGHHFDRWQSEAIP